MPFLEEFGQILEESCIVCVGNCISQRTDPIKEPQISAIYAKFPEGDVYKLRQGTKGKPGSLHIHKSGHHTIITILGQYYAGKGHFANDNPESRLKWFEQGLQQLANLSHYPRLAFYSNLDGGGSWKKYQQLIEDMHNTMGLMTQHIPEIRVIHPPMEDVNPSLLTHENEVSNQSLLKQEPIDQFPKETPDQFPKETPDQLRLDDFEIIPANRLRYFELISKYRANPDWIYHLYELPIDSSWLPVFADSLIASELRTVDQKIFGDLEMVGQQTVFYPRPDQIFATFNLCPLDQVKVLILGQDCYPGNDRGIPHACGLAFSVSPGVAIPGSLRNIYTALKNDSTLHFQPPSHGNLQKWVERGVMLLNVALTIRAGQKTSHLPFWEKFSSLLIKKIVAVKPDIIFVLWGGPAQKRKSEIGTGVSVLEYIHPSPMNGNKFHQCPNFRQVNEILTSRGQTPIDWNL